MQETQTSGRELFYRGVCIYITGSVQTSLYPLLGNGTYATLKRGMLPGLPALCECTWQHHLGCVLPGLFRALSHLFSSFSQCIIPIFAIITVILVFLQVNSKTDR